VPSLPVLFNLIHSLGEDLKTFFGSMHDQVENGKVLIVRQGEAREFKKEPIRKFVYKRILTKSISSEATDIVLLELEVGAERKKMIQTDAFECKYVLRGSIEYQVMDEKFVLNPGDTLFYDGRLRHRLKNIGKTRAQILIIYFF
jgi:quercetin dioxygenase-like cupin family protein